MLYLGICALFPHKTTAHQNLCSISSQYNCISLGLTVAAATAIIGRADIVSSAYFCAYNCVCVYACVCVSLRACTCACVLVISYMFAPSLGVWVTHYK